MEDRIIYTPSGDMENLYLDMLAKPHMLIAGTTGSGKSTIIDALIYTALYNFPSEPVDPRYRNYVAQFILIDPKRVGLSKFKRLPHTIFHAVSVEERRFALQKAIEIIEKRYRDMEVRGLVDYDGGDLYVIIDEWANLMDDDKKNAVPLTCKLVAKGRAAKVHVILATQTPTAEVLPTKIRSNFPWRMCLCTDNASQSRVILGQSGCELLPWHGYGFYKQPGPGNTALYEIPTYTEEEIAARIKWWTDQAESQGIQKEIFIQPEPVKPWWIQAEEARKRRQNQS